MKWTSDPQDIQKAVYEAGTTLLADVRARLEQAEALMDKIEEVVSKFAPSERSDDGAAAPTKAREAEVRKMISHIVAHYRSRHYSDRAADIWQQALDNPKKFRSFVEDDSKYEALTSIYRNRCT